MDVIDQGWRISRLAAAGSPEADLRLVVGDLHNHSLHSDGVGDPEQAFAQLREAGLDVAALTDHSSIPRTAMPSLSLLDYPDAAALGLARMAPRSLDEQAWQRTAELADGHDVPGEFTALRGFEWTEPWLGHVNVWFSDTFVPVTTPGSLSGLFQFLDDDEPEALFGYNHPGREPGNLDDFLRPGGGRGDPEGSLTDRMTRRMVALEAFNRREDFLFQPRLGEWFSPLVDCLDAGWRPALVGASDEHGRQYGLLGKGRTGLWVRELTRSGVREALIARRAFATREQRLRLDVRLDGVPAGGELAPADATDATDISNITDATDISGLTDTTDTQAAGAARRLLEVDLACPAHDGRRVELQLITGRGGEVVVLDAATMTCGDVHRHPVELPATTRWVVLRVADPERAYGTAFGSPVPPGHACDSWALAYGSPWFLTVPGS